ncbi:MAG: type II secretion system protein [Nitrospirota bacterium]
MRRLNGQHGFSYLFLMFTVVVIGLTVSVAMRQWKTEIRREKEAELLWRGDQIRRAIELYYLTARAGFNAYPNKLEDLVKDPNSSATRRYLRKIYTDPITNGEFELVKEGSQLKGVRSASTAAPLKTGNFPPEYQHFALKNSYRDWVFEYLPQGQKKPQT